MKENRSIYLLADSQLLFSKNEKNKYYLRSIIEQSSKEAKDFNAVYIGASNGDQPEFYELFIAAMKNIDIPNCSKISSDFNAEDEKNIDNADIILLAGGDVEVGLNVLETTGMGQKIVEKYNQGTVTIIGVSTGAIQLGWECLTGNEDKKEIRNAIQIVPFIVDTGGNYFLEWKNLKSMIETSKTMKRGIAIPSGSGIVYHGDQSVEILNKICKEFIYKNGNIKEALLCCQEGKSAVSVYDRCDNKECQNGMIIKKECILNEV